jgi:hypothetical protein
MGQKLAAYFVKAKEFGGAKAKIAFIKQVSLAASQAEALPDTPEMIAKFEDALRKVRMELG